MRSGPRVDAVETNAERSTYCLQEALFTNTLHSF